MERTPWCVGAKADSAGGGGMMSVARIAMCCAAAAFMFWVVSLSGYGTLLIWIVSAVALSAATGYGIFLELRRRRRSEYGPNLRFAMSVLTSRRKWADIAEILALSVDADLRRSGLARAVGLGRGERKAVRYIPKIAGMRCAPYGMAVAVLGAPGQSLADWQRHSGQLKSALRVPEVTVTEPRAGVFELALRVRDPLSTPIVLNSPQKADAWEIPLGVNEYGVPVCGSIRNVSGLVVGGVPGGGKSAWLTFAMASLAHRDDVQWLLIDGKQGYDLEALSPRAYRYISGEAAGEVEVVRDALQDVQTLMRERLRYSRDLYGHPNLWSISPSRVHPAVVVVIDECQTYLDPKSFSTKESKAVGAEIDSIVRDLVKRGRSAGIVVILSTQRPTADSIPTSTRDNCGLRVCFSVRTREAASAVLGEFSTETSVNPIGAPTGVGVSSVAGREVRFRSPFVPEHVIRGHIESTAVLAANPLDLLCGALMDSVSRDGEGCGDTSISHTDSSDTSRPRPAREPRT